MLFLKVDIIIFLFWLILEGFLIEYKAAHIFTSQPYVVFTGTSHKPLDSKGPI